MITSDRQLEAALKKLKLLQSSMKLELKPGTPRVLGVALHGQTQELVEELKNEIQEYKRLKNSQLVEIPIRSLEELMNAPIRYRLARKMTIEQFAHSVHVHSRQIARYES